MRLILSDLRLLKETTKYQAPNAKGQIQRMDDPVVFESCVVNLHYHRGVGVGEPFDKIGLMMADIQSLIPPSRSSLTFEI